MSQLILKRAPVCDNEDDYSVLENGTIVGRIKVPGAPEAPGWWRSQRAACLAKSELPRTTRRPLGCLVVVEELDGIFLDREIYRFHRGHLAHYEIGLVG
jgi:hypothetical protein